VIRSSSEAGLHETSNRKVLMLVLNPYEHDPRVEKEAMTLSRNGFYVTVLAWNRFGTSKWNETKDTVRIIRVGVKSPRGSRWRSIYRLPLVYLLFLKAAFYEKFDFIVAHELFTWPVGWLLKIVKGRKAIFDAHEPHAEQIIGILPGLKPFYKFVLRLERFFARRADVLVTVSPLMVDRYRRLGVRQIFYLPNVQVMNQRNGVRNPISVAGHEEFLVGRIGTISPGYSGVEHLIKIVELVAQRGRKIKLLLGGPVMNGWEKGFFSLLKGREEFITYVGAVSTSKAYELLGQFDLMASLSEPISPKSGYGFSTKIFDAMSLGVPVLTTRADEDGDLVEQTQCGVVVDYPINYEKVVQEIEHLMDSPALLRQFAENGKRSAAETYNWNLYESGFLRLFE